MGQSGSKYPVWGDFLKQMRAAKYRSARDFCSKVSVGISYPQYSRYEAGDQLPNLDQAIRLCHLLEIHVLEGILEWCLSQMRPGIEKDEVAGTLRDVRNHRDRRAKIARNQSLESNHQPQEELPSLFERPSISLDQVIVFNRSHLKLFQSDPYYRDIFTYVNSYAPDWISVVEIGTALGVEVAKLEKMVEDLSDLGVLLLAGNKCRSSKKTFYFPDDEDFFALRNQNLSWNSQKVIEKLTHETLVDRRAFRGVITRELTSDQIRKIVQGIEDLIEGMIRMPESPQPDQIYSLCVLFGERFSRKPSALASEAPVSGELPGLRVESDQEKLKERKPTS